jgi:hypothetical protein
MVNVNPAEVPPAVVTVTLAVPTKAIRLAGTAAVSWLELTNVVVSAVLFQFTVDPETKFVPFTVSVKSPPPAVAELGPRIVMVGGGGLMVNAAPNNVAPPGFTTAILAVPTEAIRPAETAAVSWLALTNVVVNAAPFQFTVAPERKFVPFTVSVKAAPPAVADQGLQPVIMGGTARARL